MHINISYDQDFYDLIFYLKSKYPKRLFDLSGIGKQLDLSELSKEFFTNKTSVSDISVDPNSNVDDRSVISYDREVSKPIFLLNSYYVLWKKMKQLYGIERANSVIEKQLTGAIYINDFTGFASKPYCYNYSTYDVALHGLPMIKKIKSIQPKHLYSFKSQMEQFIVIAANSTLGASGTGDLFITMSAYVKKCLDTLSDAGFQFKDEKSV
jgi:ribonucleoside-triphosphate reductase (formate)